VLLKWREIKYGRTRFDRRLDGARNSQLFSRPLQPEKEGHDDSAFRTRSSTVRRAAAALLTQPDCFG
jgi:hypothetical protein